MIHIVAGHNRNRKLHNWPIDYYAYARCSLKKHLKQLNNSVHFYYLKNNPGALHRQDTNRITNIKGLPYVSIDLEVGYLVSFTLMHHYTIIPPLIVIDHSLLHTAVLCGVVSSTVDQNMKVCSKTYIERRSLERFGVMEFFRFFKVETQHHTFTIKIKLT